MITSNRVCLVFLFILVFISGCSNFLSRFYTDPQQCYQEALMHKPFDAAIIPGFPHQPEAWDAIVKNRVYWAVFLYNKGIVKNLIFSGGAVYTPFVESRIMALYAEKLGIPVEHIFTETQAEHSTENLYFSYELAREKGFSHIALASDPTQTSFLKGFAKKLSFDVRFIPIIYDTLRIMPRPEPEIDDESEFVQNFTPITERESLFKRLRGTRGHKVKQLMREKKRAERSNSNNAKSHKKQQED